VRSRRSIRNRRESAPSGRQVGGRGAARPRPAVRGARPGPGGLPAVRSEVACRGRSRLAARLALG